MPIQGLKFNIQSGGEAHLSFQATGSFTAYNPNDGYALIALDRTSTLLDYDHKLPSQSGGHFPGPINSYLSIYFVDQSGAGLSGQIIVYASPDTLQIPQFWSIGRAIQAQVTSLDLIQGVQPGNPPANTTRLWSDANGHLHLAHSDGSDYIVLDSNNYASIITLVGDVTGLVGNTVQTLRNNSAIWYQDTGGTYRQAITVNGPNILYWAVGNSAFRWVNQANSVEWMRVDGSTLVVAGAGSFGSTVTSGDLHSSRANDTGVLYLGNSNTHYLYFDGATFQLTNNTAITGSLTVSGNTTATGLTSNGAVDSGDGHYYFVHNASIYLYWNGTQMVLSHRLVLNEQLLYWHPNLTVYSQLVYPWLNMQNLAMSVIGSGALGGTGTIISNGQHCTAGSYDAAHGNGFLAPNNNPGGVGLAQSWGTWSSVEHARQYGLPISDVVDPLLKVKSIAGVYYEHMNFDPVDPIAPGVTPRKKEDGSYDTRPLYGFSARDVYAILPELVGLDPETKEPESIDLDRMLVVLWEAVKELDGRLTKLEPVA